MRKAPFTNGNIYHVFNRGVDRRDIFLENPDYFRFIHDLYEFNDKAPAPNAYYSTSYDFGDNVQDNREPIVDILAFCLMPNHFHLLLRQREDNGITFFMRKIGCGYANYFNTKNERSGALFQGRFKAVYIQNNFQLLHIPYYIHANPIDLVQYHWKEKGLIKTTKHISNFLESYRWSSYPDYVGKRNFPVVIQKEFLNNLVGGKKQFKKTMALWIQHYDQNNVLDISID